MQYVIKGGEFNNKGAEAMTFATIDLIRRKDPNAMIYMNDTGEPYGEDLKVEYFIFPSWYFEEIYSGLTFRVVKEKIANFIKIFFPSKKRITKHDIRRSEEILRHNDVFLDISGFALGDKWGEDGIKEYITWINIQKKYSPKCTIYLLPQSFGPFEDYPYLNAHIFSALSKCNKIYAREEQGYNSLLDFGLTNVEKRPDMVLTSQDIDYNNVFFDIKKYVECIELKEGPKVGIIPNMRMIDMAGISLDELVALYSEMVKENERGCTFYLLAHAAEDLKICESIKMNFFNNNSVILIDHVLPSFNFENVVANFDYVVASRYHAIVHSLKEYTPTVIFGWSEKYEEIAKEVGVTQYVAQKESLLATVRKMDSQYPYERILLSEFFEKQNGQC